MPPERLVPSWIVHSLARQVAAIHDEMAQWTAKRHEELRAHARQIDRVRLWTDALALQRDLDSLAVAGALQDDDAAGFLEAAFQLQTLVSGAREVWEFYRDRFELIYSPLTHYEAWIEGAEWVAADIYRTAILNASRTGLEIDLERWEAPLLQLSTESATLISTPVTRARGTRIARGSQSYPTPIIVLPADLMASAWGFLAIHHEVGHDIDADLAAAIEAADPAIGHLSAVTKDLILRENGAPFLQMLVDRGIPPARAGMWTVWVPELFADFFALLSAGPAFAAYMMDALSLPRGAVFRQQYAPPYTYPSPYLRCHILIRFVETLENGAYAQLAADYRERWDGIYARGHDPDQPMEAYLAQTGIVPEHVDGYLAEDFSDIDAFIAALVDTPFYVSDSGRAVALRDLGAYSAREHRWLERIVAQQLMPASSPGVTGRLAPRLAPAAARFAFEGVIASAASDMSPAALADALERLNTLTLRAIETNRPGDVLVEEGEERAAERLQLRANRFRQQTAG